MFRYINREADMKVKKQTQKAIDEAYEVRNVIVHRGGKIDHRLKSRAPDFEGEIDQQIELKATRFLEYQTAILEFAGMPSMWNL
jgi:hypothetical protein